MRIRPVSAVLGVTLFAGAAAAQDQTFLIVNRSPADLAAIYVSPAAEARWGPDVLAETHLVAGRSIALLIRNGREQCEYDFRLVYAGGETVEKWRNICLTPYLTLE